MSAQPSSQSSSQSSQSSSRGAALLQRWWDLKQRLKELQKEDTMLREKFKTYLTSRNLTTVRYRDFRISYRVMSRETISKKNCPAEIWKKYCTKSTYPVVRLEYFDAVNAEDEPDEGTSEA